MSFLVQRWTPWSGVSQHDACNESQIFWDVEGHSASLPGAFSGRKLRLFDREWSKGDETRLDAVAQMRLPVVPETTTTKWEGHVVERRTSIWRDLLIRYICFQVSGHAEGGEVYRILSAH